MRKSYFLIFLLFYLGTGINNAQIQVLLNFNDTNGSYPSGNDVMLLGSRLYGMTTQGGRNKCGVVFSIDTNGNDYKKLLDFNDTNGKYPRGALINLGDKLFGMTTYGGKDSAGCIFSIDTSGNNYRKLLDFNDTNGAKPYGSLVFVGSKLYGMTSAGGLDSLGCIFSIDTNGNEYNDLHNFNDTSGAVPFGNLILSGNQLFGMTADGGNVGHGCLFSMDTNGLLYKDIVDFYSGKNNGNLPIGSLTFNGGELFGMTKYGGTSTDGNAFGVNTNGSSYTDILDFGTASVLGSFPVGSLTASDYKLFGMTSYSGSASGTIFSVDFGGFGYQELFNFNGIDGSEPLGSLIVSGDNLYGMTAEGGSHQKGIVFRYNYATAGVDKLEQNSTGINIFPSPNTGLFTLQSNTVNVNSIVEIYNMLGEEVYTSKLKTKNTQIDLSGSAAGIYLYRVLAETGNLIATGKLIIQK